MLKAVSEEVAEYNILVEHDRYDELSIRINRTKTLLCYQVAWVCLIACFLCIGKREVFHCTDDKIFQTTDGRGMAGYLLPGLLRRIRMLYNVHRITEFKSACQLALSLPFEMKFRLSDEWDRLANCRSDVLELFGYHIVEATLNVNEARDYFVEARLHHHSNGECLCAQFLAFTEFFDTNEYFAERTKGHDPQLKRRNPTMERKAFEYIDYFGAPITGIIRKLALAYHDKDAVKYQRLLTGAMPVLRYELRNVLTRFLEVDPPIGLRYAEG